MILSRLLVLLFVALLTRATVRGARLLVLLALIGIILLVAKGHSNFEETQLDDLFFVRRSVESDHLVL